MAREARRSLAGRAVEGLAAVAFHLAAVMVAAMAVLVSTSVLSRYLFGRPSRLVFELAEYALLYIALLGAGRLALRGQHVRMEVLEAIAPERVVAFVGKLSDLFCLGLSLVLLVAGAWVTFDAYVRQIRTVGVAGPPMWMVLAALPLGALVLVAAYLLRVLGRRRERPGPDGRGA